MGKYSASFLEMNLLSLLEKLRDNQISASELVTLTLFKSPLQLQKKKWNPHRVFESKILQTLNDYHFRGVEDRARRSLFMWHEGHYPLELMQVIPSPLEVLQLQSRGKRIVTVFLKEEEWQQLHLGKTAWDFTLHDLIHADHFFEKPDWRQGQIQFYRFILKNWEHPEIESLKKDPGFEYLISDMNSHPQHLFLTLRALVLKSFKSQLGYDPKEKLSTAHEGLYQSLCQDWSSELDRTELPQ